MKRNSIVSILVVLLILASVSSVFAADLNEKITAMTIKGNNKISTVDIMSQIKTKVGDTLDKDQLKKDMQNVYDMGYFQDIKITFKNYNGGLEVIFNVVENPVIKDIKLEGNPIYDKAKVMKIIGLNIGDVLDVSKLHKGIDNLRNNYQDDGYILAQVTNVNVTKEGILNIEINPGYLNDIVLKGNDKTKDFVIKRQLVVKGDSIFNVNDLKKSSQNLYNLRYFKEVKPELKRVDGKDNKVDLVLNFTEDTTGNLRFGGGYSSKDGWIGFIKVQERNLMGKGQTLGFDWQFGDTNNYSLNFYEPWLFGNPTSFGASIYDNTSDRTDSQDQNYVESKQGGSVSFGHALNKTWDGTARYKIENTDINWDDDSYKTDTSGSTRSLTLKADRDTTNHPFNPTTGAIDTVSVEYAGSILGGDYDFTKYDFDLRRFYPGFKSGQAWALRLKAGFGDGDLPFAEKYKVGGSQSLRGYDSYKFDGNDMLLLNLEYRFPIADKFTGVLFADAGNAWDSRSEMNLDELNKSLGLGVRMNTPIGQIRLDYAWNQDGEGMPHFSIGQTF